MKINISGLAWFDKAELPEPTVAYLKQQLTVTQRVSKEYQKRSKPAIVELWADDGERFGVPREYFFNTVTQRHDITYTTARGEGWGPAEKFESEDGESTPEWVSHVSADDVLLYDATNNRPVTLKPEQSAAIAATKAHLLSCPAAGGLVQAPTGWGKSVFAIVLAHEMKVKTAILVHREFLSNQWKERIAQFLPNAKVGTIAGKKYDTDGCHIVLVMIETVASWAKKGKVPDRIKDEFGLVIADEVHRAAAPLWSLSLPQFRSAYRIGISAHPTRADGLEKILEYHIGKKIYTGTALSRTPRVRRVFTNYEIKHPRLNSAMLSMEAAFKVMSGDNTYNQDVIDQIKMAVEKGRKIFVFSHTIKHLNRLKEMADAQLGGAVTDYYIGGMSQDDLDVAAKATVIFGSYQMAKDSLDIPALDTVVLAGPVRNPTQPGGRCCRDFPGKKDPVIVDMRADNVAIFRDYGESRDRVYARIYGETPSANSSQTTMPLTEPSK